MPIKTEARCALQIAREHRLKKHPGEFGPEQDICDVTGWLRQNYPLSNARLVIYRHYTQHGREIADISVSSVRPNAAPLAAHVLEAFAAPGYNIEDTGGDTYCCPSCNGHHSSHENSMAYARIEGIYSQRSKT